MLIKHNGKYYRDKTEITAVQYNEIQTIIRNRPTAPEGYEYRLTNDLEWELYELPAEEQEDEEATVEDYQAALAELGVSE